MANEPGLISHNLTPTPTLLQTFIRRRLSQLVATSLSGLLLTLSVARDSHSLAALVTPLRPRIFRPSLRRSNRPWLLPSRRMIQR